MTTDIIRQIKSRERKRALGLVQVAVWILPESKAEIRAIAERDKAKAQDASTPK